MNDKEFGNFKKQVLQNPDASKKGNIDEPMQPVLELINSHSNFVSLSSCSGRTSVVLQSFEVDVQKEGCQWAYCTHKMVEPIELMRCVHDSLDKGQLTLKFEPFILHVACKSLEDAKGMLNCALLAGCKNSGMVIGKRDRYTVAVRNTLQMEVPLTHKGNLLVSEEFMNFAISQANDKMRRNLEKLGKFESCLEGYIKAVA